MLGFCLASLFFWQNADLSKKNISLDMQYLLYCIKIINNEEHSNHSASLHL